MIRSFWWTAFVAVIALISYQVGTKPDMSINHWDGKKPPTAPLCVTIDLDHKKYAHILDHTWDAIDQGAPRILHIDREGADHNRDQSLHGIPTWGQLSYPARIKADPRHPTTPHDRDEYPPAVSKEGGTGANVRYVLSAENRGAGTVMGEQLQGYKDGQCFQIEARPR